MFGFPIMKPSFSFTNVKLIPPLKMTISYNTSAIADHFQTRHSVDIGNKRDCQNGNKIHKCENLKAQVNSNTLSLHEKLVVFASLLDSRTFRALGKVHLI